MYQCSRRAVFVLAMLMAAAPAVAAQQAPIPPVPQLPAAKAQPAKSATISGQVRRAGTLKPVANVAVLIEGTSLQATTDAEGKFSIAGVPAGTHHLFIAAPGLMPLHVDVTVGATPPAPLDVLLDTEVHYTEIVSVSPNARDPFVSYQPTSVLSGQAFSKELEATLGATLQRQAGVSERSFGPGPSRPVIRGLDGDRVLILEDGQRVGDLSSQSGDHGVTVNPASASRIEVVRGPATLLYGSNAIGGLVNVINETIPTTPIHKAHGALLVDFGSAATDIGTAGDVRWGNGKFALTAGGSGRRNRDVRTPRGRIDNTQRRAGFGNVGLAWTPTEQAFLGASYGYDDTRYGVPFVEEGQVELTPRRHQFAVKAGASEMKGLLESVRASYAARRYRHEEIIAGDVGTRFRNDTNEFDLLLRHKPIGRLSGTLGIWAMTRRFGATGEEALSPPVDAHGAAAFFYEEIAWPHATFQFGARVNHASFDPEDAPAGEPRARAGDLPARNFTDISGSLGLLLRPAAANDKLTLAISVARSARNPALEELYFFGPHPGNFAFEAGNPNLDSERGIGVDVSLRWRQPRFSGEIGYFRNAIGNYIFRNPLNEAEFDAKYGHDTHDDGEGHAGEFPFIEFIAADSVLQGIESHADINLGGGLDLELGFDYVRGDLSDLDQPLPRIPPLRIRAGLNYQRDAFTAGAEILATSKQSRVFGEETPTAGYGNLRLFSSYSFGRGGVVHTVTGRIDNATDTLYANHLSLIKDFVPEMGRNVKLVYSLRF